jgi:uncharacterized damage-inducible protein DinB
LISERLVDNSKPVARHQPTNQGVPLLACQHLKLMASYNEWMNAKVYEAATRLAPEELAADRGAFFGSILGTLNHLVTGDTIWLKRFAAHPSAVAVLAPVCRLPDPVSLAHAQFADLPALAERRGMLDQAILEWVAALTEKDLHLTLRYANSKGIVSERNYLSLVMHFFNHQTHHRGQVTTLLTQAGVDVGTTDLLALVPDFAVR